MPEPMTLKSFWDLLKRAYAGWSEINAPRLGAALAFYTLWAAAPLVMVCLGIAGLVFGRAAAQHQIGAQLQHLTGGAGGALQSLMANASQPSRNIAAAAAGFVLLVLGASGVFAELHDSLNLVWGVAPPQGNGLAGIVKTRFFAFLMVLGIGLLLMLSLVVSAGISIAARFFSQYLPLPGAALHAANGAAGFVIVTLLFALLYKLVPQTRVEWGDVWIGAAVTSLLFATGKFLIGLYLGSFGVNSAYGAASSLVVFIVWVYYSAQIFFLGAEFTRAFAERHGSRSRRGQPGPVPIRPPQPRKLA